MPEKESDPNVLAVEKARAELQAAISKLTADIEPALNYHLKPHPLAKEEPAGDNE